MKYLNQYDCVTLCSPRSDSLKRYRFRLTHKTWRVQSPGNVLLWLEQFPTLNCSNLVDNMILCGYKVWRNEEHRANTHR